MRQNPIACNSFSLRAMPKVAQQAASILRRRTELRPKLAIILGSGFQAVGQGMDIRADIAFADLPGFTAPGVQGHPGRVLLGRMASTPVLVLNGRTHFYEGHSMEVVTIPVRALAAFGITDLLLTNAAGGIKPGLRPGDFMVITDHINFMGVNPLRGPATKGITRFVDLSQVYDAGLSKLLHAAARELEMSLKTGVYLAISGPSYETPAEIRAFARLGAAAVGMSTVPEAIVARQCGLRVAGISCITNLAAGRTRAPITHREVLETGKRVGNQARTLLEGFAREYGRLVD